MAEGEEMTTCWCPKCETFHKIRMHWIGRGIPRIYCSCCKRISELNEEIIYPNPQNIFREMEGIC